MTALSDHSNQSQAARLHEMARNALDNGYVTSIEHNTEGRMTITVETPMRQIATRWVGSTAPTQARLGDFWYDTATGNTTTLGTNTNTWASAFRPTYYYPAEYVELEVTNDQGLYYEEDLPDDED